MRSRRFRRESFHPQILSVSHNQRITYDVLCGLGPDKDRAMDQNSLADVGRAAVGDTSITRVLGILDLFTPETAVWTVDLLVERMGLGRATVYRYVRALCDAGFLVPVAGAGYVLGPRVIEFDRSIRLADPLLHIVPPGVAELRTVVNGAQLLCAFYGLRVLTVLQDKTDPNITMSMERGRPFPLFQGSPSRVILAHLPTYQLRNLALNHQ